jgi:hypothetical protein
LKFAINNFPTKIFYHLAYHLAFFANAGVIHSHEAPAPEQPQTAGATQAGLQLLHGVPLLQLPDPQLEAV